MKRFIVIFAILVGVQAWGQVDTLEFTTRRQVADTLFGLFDQTIYGSSLIDRSLTDDSLLIQQINGNYSGISNGFNWFQAYSDMAISYTDSTSMLSDSLLYAKLVDFHMRQIGVDTLDNLVQPFGLMIHTTSKIDTSLFSIPDAFLNQNGQLALNAEYNESDIYSNIKVKNAAILELYGQHGYSEGTLIYDSSFISVSPDIGLQKIWLDLGNGYQSFSPANPVISYSIKNDWQIGHAAIEYTIDYETFYDTLNFYTSTVQYKYANQDKSDDGWDSKVIEFKQGGETQFEFCIKYGCGNGTKVKRPIIIVPPYRPIIQTVSFNKYYDQFNFKSLFSSLSEMGYDVIFIKETPGNRGINHAGGILADFIKFINTNKAQDYPNEDWENILIGFSAGGQHCRYALKKLEYEHMATGTAHHHTRLYIPFDSPHWGANVPMFTQTVYKDMSATNFWAYMAYQSLNDAASKDMLMNHVLGSNIVSSGTDRLITPAPTAEFMNISSQLNNWYNHEFTPLNDLRRTFPTFTRNVAISVGGNELDYKSPSLYNFTPGMTLFTQNFFVPGIFGVKHINRTLSSSYYTQNASVFSRNDTYMVGLIVPVINHRHYKTIYAYEWDMAQGGYKDEFYDGYGLGIIPIGAIPILRSTVLTSVIGPFLGTKSYEKHVCFLPTVSSLGINPAIWQNNNLYYNVKEQGLMYQNYSDILSQNKSDLYGYPNLGHPNNHFQITPFEAVYCDPQTYQHIKMEASVHDDGLDDTYLVHTRNFILDEVEANDLYLQNKIIGKNHVQWMPYSYKAWYKAIHDIVVGHSVSPKTDPGDYVIEKTGDITMYACHEVNLKPGFRAEAGSNFHAFVLCDGCARPGEHNNKSADPSTGGENETLGVKKSPKNQASESIDQLSLKVYPNPTSGQTTVVFPLAAGSFTVCDINGRIIVQQKLENNIKTHYLNLSKGVFYLKWINETNVLTTKISVL